MWKKFEIIMSVILLVSALCVGFTGIVLPFSRNEPVERANEKADSFDETDGAENEESEENEGQKVKHTVVLDAGHGADDPGKVGVSGALEKDINLSITLCLQKLLSEQGYRVILTRSDDNPLYEMNSVNHKLSDMEKRVSIIEESACDLVVSIHQNSFPQGEVHGPQVFYYSSSKEGERLAACIQKGFDYAVGSENTRSIKRNSQYYLLIHVKCPLVIAECGFLSNEEEEQKLISEEYQNTIAISIFNGINDYFQ